MPTALTRHGLEVLSRTGGGGGGGRSFGSAGQSPGVAPLYGGLRVVGGSQSPGVAPLYGGGLRVIQGGQSSSLSSVRVMNFDARSNSRPVTASQGLSGGQSFSPSGLYQSPGVSPTLGAREFSSNASWLEPFSDPGAGLSANIPPPPSNPSITSGWLYYYTDFVNSFNNGWVEIFYQFSSNNVSLSGFTNKGTQFGYININDGGTIINDYLFQTNQRADGQWSATNFRVIGANQTPAPGSSPQQPIPAGINPSPNPGPLQTIAAQATAKISNPLAPSQGATVQASASPTISPQLPAAPAPAPGTIPGTVAPAPAPAPTQAPGSSPSVAPMAPATTPAPAPGTNTITRPAAFPSGSITPNGQYQAPPTPAPQSPPASQPASSDPCAQSVRLLEKIQKRQEECCNPSGPPDCPTDIANIPIVSCVDGEAVYNYIPVPVPAGAGLLVEVVFSQLAESMAASCQGSPIFGDIGGGLGTLSQVLGAIGASVGQVNEKVETQALSLAELIQRLEQLKTTIGVDEFPVTMPETLLAYRDGKTSQLANFAQWMAWYIRQFDAIAGQFPIEIEVTDIDPATEGNQTRKVSLPNISETLAELYGLSVTSSVNADLAINFLMRLTGEILSIKTAGIVTQDHARAISEFLGYRGNPAKREVPCNFDLNNLDSLEKILKESKATITGWKNDDKETVVGFLQRLMFSAGIIKQVFFRNSDRLADLKEELTSMGSTEGDDAAWQEFLRFINDPQSAFNLRNTSDATPRVKDIPPTNP